MSKSSRLWATLFLSTVASVAVVLRQVDTVHAMQGSEGANWVGYSALDVETMSTIDAAGKQTEKLTVIEEFRSSDGFLLTIIKSNGPRVRGLADGRQFSLDYANQTAREIEPFPRRHPTVPPDPILGSKSISGVNCLIYPVYGGGRRGMGTICVDIKDDILGEHELHIDESGIHQIEEDPRLD